MWDCFYLFQKAHHLHLEWKEAFSLYDKKGNSTVSSANLGDLLRGLGQNPTQAEVAELVKDTAKSKGVPETQGKETQNALLSFSLFFYNIRCNERQRRRESSYICIYVYMRKGGRREEKGASKRKDKKEGRA